MITVDLFTKEDCLLCVEAKELLQKLRGEFSFEVREILLTPSHPDYPHYKDRVPVVIAPNGTTASGKVTEDQIRGLLLPLTPPAPLYYGAKFLEALGIVIVFFGLIHGLSGDMWSDLYFFLTGIVVFGAGRALEKWEKRRRQT